MDRALKRLFSLKMADQLEDASKARIVDSRPPNRLSAPDSAEGR
jgi:hypothetical protein